jgi:F-type H+-transporting ATPase subunit alpha
VPREKVQEFEREFLDTLERKHADVLSALSRGEINDIVSQTLEQVCAEIVARFKTNA